MANDATVNEVKTGHKNIPYKRSLKNWPYNSEKLHIQSTVLCGKISFKKNWPKSHMHTDFFEVMYFSKGIGKQKIASHIYNVQAGDIFFIPMYEEHQLVEIKKKITYYYLEFPLGLFGVTSAREEIISNLPVLLPFFCDRNKFPHKINIPSAQRETFIIILNKILSEYKESGILTVSIVYHLLNALLYEICRIYTKKYNLIASKTNPLVVIAEEYIKKNFQLPISSALLARQLRNNPSYLSRIFSAETGMSFQHYLEQVRINHAKDLIINTDFKFLRIALEIGFTDAAYFSHVFKKVTGMTPKGFARQFKKK
ncbi:MAG: hypothetical protein A2096_09730 [Spirochaetes bacterium GWF1_41_5]|nr:MAG: hypothetical protein A2096_09730 [Spirochaetes bacterium GWF1_41_5]